MPLRRLAPFFGLALFTGALLALHYALREYHYEDVVRSMREIPLPRLGWAFGLTVLNYAVMTGYDGLALRYVRHALPYRKIAFASFIGYAFSNNVGLSMLAGSSVRYRLYSAWGLTAVEITQVVAFYTLTLWLGLSAVGGVSFLFDPLKIPLVLHLPFATVRPVGVVFLGIVAAYVFFAVVRRTPLTLLRWRIPLPSPGLSLAQLGVSCMDWLLAGSALYVLLPSSGQVSFPAFLTIYLLAQTAGLVSQVPGGLGVFETVVILFLSPALPASQVFGSLLAYRGIYYLLPFFTAVVMLGAFELLRQKERLARLAAALAEWGPAVVPRILSFTTFLAGAILLFSGATPSVQSRLAWLRDVLPLPVVEISHFLGSLAGAALLILARGLQRRLNGAYHITIVLLSAGAVFSLLKGFDYEESAILTIMLGALLSSHGSFYRKSSLLNEPFTPGWTAAVVLVLAGTVWLGLFSYKHVEYSSDLWWHFAFFGDAPRFLRAAVGSIGIVVTFGIVRLLRPAPPEPALPDKKDLDRARAAIAQSRATYPYLALLGDKRLLFSASERAFIMYGVEGRSWVAMGDPVGAGEEREEVAWRFIDLCDRHAGWPVFYEVGRESLSFYGNLGLTAFKIGEQARVRLDTFTLEGSERKGLRYIVHRNEREGSRFFVVPPSGTSPLLPELKKISDAWIAERRKKEMRFSLGFFKEEYLREFPAGIVRRDGRVIAFSNIWPGAEKEELSIDLMRYLPGAPRGTMEYLFISLMLWGKSEGYQWFNLGMAPLSGLEAKETSSPWSRIGAMVYRHGEHFYNFQGLRQYKERFSPIWEPRYLVSPGGLALPRIIANIASLVSGGRKGVIVR